MNNLKTVLLLALMSGLVVFLGEAIGGQQGLQIGLLLAVGLNFFSYFFSEQIALRTTGALPVTPTENADIYVRLAPIVERLCRRMELPMPKLWVIPEQAPNAFATGRDPHHASVAVTAGIFQVMNDAELEGVLAHELGHVKHRDILIASVAATLATALSVLARMGLWFGGRRDEGNRGASIFSLLAALIIAPMIAAAVSRSREYEADAASAQYAGGPHGLISALRKLETYRERIPMDVNPATSHLFIVAPLTAGSFLQLYSSHPPTEKRIAALQQLG